MKNKLEKFLIGLSSFLLVALGVLGIKIQSDNQKSEETKDSIVPENNSSNTPSLPATNDAVKTKESPASAPNSSIKPNSPVQSTTPVPKPKANKVTRTTGG